jgi:prepilin-type N-terminal cleavage/methylation domain-containing protein
MSHCVFGPQAANGSYVIARQVPASTLGQRPMLVAKSQQSSGPREVRQSCPIGVVRPFHLNPSSRSTSPSPYPVRCAFSLIELVIVLMLMGIVAAVAVPTFFDSLLFHRVESAARRVKADLELARNTARLTSASQTITFNNAARTYALSAAIKDLDRPNQTYTVDLSKSPYKLNTLTAVFGGTAVITFDGYAKPSVAGSVIVQIDANHKATVTLDGTTGQVTITSNQSRGRSAEAQ